MIELNTILLREKFTIRDAAAPNGGKGKNASLVALSNRLVVPLPVSPASGGYETFIVRAQNMHSTIRFAARIIKEFEMGGPLMTRAVKVDWEKLWGSIVNDYEYAYNPARWVAIYHEGKVIFEQGERNPFLDMIEKCDIGNTQEYDFSIPMAEALLKKTGKNVNIVYDANAALNLDFADNQGRCGIILRGSNKTTTFSFSVKPGEKTKKINVAQAMSAAAAFLEGVQLAFLIGFNTVKIQYGIIKRFSKEEKQTREGKDRLRRLRTEIANLENTFTVRYRPEKPEFHLLLNEAEELGHQILEPVEDEDEEAEAEGESKGDGLETGETDGGGDGADTPDHNALEKKSDHAPDAPDEQSASADAAGSRAGT